MNVNVNSINSVTQYSLYPNPNHVCLPSHNNIGGDNNITVVTSNCTTSGLHNANAMRINPTHAIANTGATSIFVMAEAPAHNICLAKNPITISLPGGKQITSTHTCDFVIPGLPQTLIGHNVPEMKMASLIGIRILCKAGCEVIFDDKKCRVNFKGNAILRGTKDTMSNLGTLSIQSPGGKWTTPGPAAMASTATASPSRPGPGKGRAPLPP